MKVSEWRSVGVVTKAPQLVARRNARERRRVQAVNSAFNRLRRAVPGDQGSSRGKRVSKVKTLKRAIEYISNLLSLLTDPPYHPWPQQEYKMLSTGSLDYCCQRFERNQPTRYTTNHAM